MWISFAAKFYFCIVGIMLRFLFGSVVNCKLRKKAEKNERNVLLLYASVCVSESACVCVCVSLRERERESGLWQTFFPPLHRLHCITIKRWWKKVFLVSHFSLLLPLLHFSIYQFYRYFLWQSYFPSSSQFIVPFQTFFSKPFIRIENTLSSWH